MMEFIWIFALAFQSEAEYPMLDFYYRASMRAADKQRVSQNTDVKVKSISSIVIYNNFSSATEAAKWLRIQINSIG